jgi:hypothetical protein
MRESHWLSRNGGRVQVRVPLRLALWLKRHGKIDDEIVHEHRADGTVETIKLPKGS